MLQAPITPTTQQLKRLSVQLSDDTIVEVLKSSKQTQEILGIKIPSKKVKNSKKKKKHKKKIRTHGRVHSEIRYNLGTPYSKQQTITCDNENININKFPNHKLIKQNSIEINSNKNISLKNNNNNNNINQSSSKPEKRSKSTKPETNLIRKTPKNVKRFVKWIGNNFTKIEKKNMMSDIKWKPKLRDIMNDRGLFNAFLMFCEKKYVDENLLFLEQVKKLNAKIDMIRLNTMKDAIVNEHYRVSFSANTPEIIKNKTIHTSDESTSIYQLLKINENEQNKSINNQIELNNDNFNIDDDDDDDQFGDDYGDQLFSDLFSAENKKDIENDIDRKIKFIFDEFIGNKAPNQVNISFGTLSILKKKRKNYLFLTLFEKSQLFSRANIEIERLLKVNVIDEFYTSTELHVVAQSRPKTYDPRDYLKLYDKPTSEERKEHDKQILKDKKNTIFENYSIDEKNEIEIIDFDDNITENIDCDIYTKVRELSSTANSMRISISAYTTSSKNQNSIYNNNINNNQIPSYIMGLQQTNANIVNESDNYCTDIDDEFNDYDDDELYKFSNNKNNDKKDSLCVPDSKKNKKKRFYRQGHNHKKHDTSQNLSMSQEFDLDRIQIKKIKKPSDKKAFSLFDKVTRLKNKTKIKQKKNSIKKHSIKKHHHRNINEKSHRARIMSE